MNVNIEVGTNADNSLKKRFFALFIDYLVIVAYGGILAILSRLLQPVLMPLFTSDPITAELTGFFLITLPVVLYFFLFESSSHMGTFGKRKAGIKVVDASGNQIRKRTALIRSIVKFLPWELAHFAIWRLYFPTDLSETPIMVLLTFVNLLALAYLITPLTNRKQKAVHDWIAGTRVVARV